MKKILFILIISIFIISSCNDVENKTNVQKEEIDFMDIPMQLTNGEQITLNELKGKVVVLDFWASWCGPCRKSIPFYNKMHDKYSEKGLVIIGLNVNESEEQMNKNLKKMGIEIKYPVALPNEKLIKIFKISGIPSMFLFDKNGNQIDNIVGYGEELDNKIESMILEQL